MLRGAFWLSLAATLGIYAAMVTWSLPRLQEEAGGLRPFDLRPLGYGAEEARALLAALDPAATAFYLTVQQRLDSVYPPLVALTLILAFALLLPRRWAAFAAVPALAAAAFDLSENAAVAELLRSGPDASGSDIARANLWTILKGAAYTVAFSILLVALGCRLLGRWRRR